MVLSGRKAGGPTRRDWYRSSLSGGVAQLVERLTGSQEVRGFESHRLHQRPRSEGPKVPEKTGDDGCVTHLSPQASDGGAGLKNDASGALGESIRLNFDEEDSILVPQVRADVLTMLTPVMFRLPSGELQYLGTAFCIATLINGQAVFVTARHVIEDLEDDLDLDPMLFVPKSIHDASENLFVGLSIEQVGVAQSHSDVALLRVDLNTGAVPIDGTLRRVRIGLRRPELGKKMLALGYPRQSILDENYFIRDFRASSGHIIEVYDDQRDAGLGNFPSFRTTGLFAHGMSGGPVFISTGEVVGVVSWGSPPDDDTPPDGYAALAAGLAELKIDLTDDNGIEREFTFGELVELGAITTSQEGGVRLTRQHTGVKVTWL